jgi:two-component system NtrC family sensor kinase
MLKSVTVSLSTKKVDNKIEIKVTDCSNSIPKKILEKIFQPYFTIKPKGELIGLSFICRYDIIKVHGDEIKVETKEGERPMFTIVLPDL